MLDEASLIRLAEIGVDVYAPRRRAAAASVSGAATPAGSRTARAAVAADEPRAGRVLLVAEANAPAGLLADVARTLGFARIDSALVADPDAAELAAARGLVLFGDAHARRIGAALPAQRQHELAWIVTADAAALAGDARAKRALWSELKRLARTQAAAPRPEA